MPDSFVHRARGRVPEGGAGWGLIAACTMPGASACFVLVHIVLDMEVCFVPAHIVLCAYWACCVDYGN